MIFDVKLYF